MACLRVNNGILTKGNACHYTPVMQCKIIYQVFDDSQLIMMVIILMVIMIVIMQTIVVYLCISQLQRCPPPPSPPPGPYQDICLRLNPWGGAFAILIFVPGPRICLPPGQPQGIGHPNHFGLGRDRERCF